MEFTKEYLELQIIDCAPEGVGELTSATFGNAGPGGKELYFTGGEGALLWYDPETGEKGFVDDDVSGGVGLTIEDVDGDGIGEIFLADMKRGSKPGCQAIAMYKLDGHSWKRHLITSSLPGNAHDIVFGDIDNDGVREIVTIACYTPTPGVFILKPTDYDGGLPVKWSQHTVSTGIFTEGVSIGDLNGDGKMEIVSGPDWYEQPGDGPYAGFWTRHTYATTYREMCRTALADVTGNGRPDIFITDSENMDGTLSWYENRLGATVGPEWVEHQLNDKVVYSHTLEVRQRDSGVDVFIAEMEQGGWVAPYNFDARLLLYSTDDHGSSWKLRELYKGEGTHEATIRYGKSDTITVYGKSLGRYWLNPRVQVWREPAVLSHLKFNHVMIDRDKRAPGTDILAFDPAGSGKKAIACGKWVYLPDGWKRIELPGVSQIINACDIDGDGRDELIATTLAEPDSEGKVSAFNNELCWLKLKDGTDDQWDMHVIGKGCGDWPHGSLVAPVLPGDKQALMLSYHSVNSGHEDYPQILRIPDDPVSGNWEFGTLAEIMCGEEMVTAEITGSGRLDIVAGAFWLRNNGDGSFMPFTIVEDFMAARVVVADIAGNGRPDVVLVEEAVDYQKRVASFVRVAWFECPANPETEPWAMHIIDSIRSPHSISVGDIDGDGISEFIVAEHDPFWPYRSRNRLFVYKTKDLGATWFRRTIDGRFEHHDGGKLADLGDGQQVIMSHGWNDSIYVHLWEISTE